MEYEKCLVQLDEILKYLKDEDLRKIPYEIRKAINEKKDKNYNWNYDESKALNEQKLDRKTIAMLSYLNMEYLLNEEQRLLMEKMHRFNEEKAEKQKREKYDPSDVFDSNSYNVDEKIKAEQVKVNEDYSNMQMIKTKEDKWYKKIIKAIAHIFHKNI